jgi:hypothetical protein
MATSSADLFAVQDVVLSISTFLSLKQLNSLRNTSKQLNSWLSDRSSFSWKKRIELSFPNNHQSVLKQSAKDQVAQLQVFDTLVDNGHRVSFFPLQVDAVKANSKYQLPWARHLILILYGNTSAFIFDMKSGKESTKMNERKLRDMKSIDTVYFDVKNRKIGFVNSLTGKMKMFVHENNEIMYEADFTCDALKSDEHERKHRPDRVMKQIYGDYVIVKKDYSLLAWYSLSTNEEIKVLILPDTDGVYLAASIVRPEIYVSATEENVYVIRKIDCTLQTDEPMTRVYSSKLKIHWDNCGDGVGGLRLIETEQGRLLHVYLLGTGNRAFDAYDIATDEIVESIRFDEFWDYKSIRYNPGTKFYCLKSGYVFAVKESDIDYEDEKVLEQEDKEEEEEKDYRRRYDEEENEAVDGAYFKIQRTWDECTRGEWLNKDLLSIKAYLGRHNIEHPRQIFFSIAKRDVIGWLEDDIAEVFMSGTHILAFTPCGDFYRISLDLTDCEPKSDDSKKDETKEMPETKDSSAKDQGNSKKRKASEMDSDGQAEEKLESPTKKRRFNCCIC